jgi:acetyl-CoA carboxylase biotin carboxylase subunit
VAEQIAVAAGEGLRITESKAAPQGCAIECRINAEDPAADFMPSPGLITHAEWPQALGVRVDTWVESGSRVSPYYDSLIGKIIVHAPSRAEAVTRMRSALAATRIEGVRTNIEFQAAVLGSADFQAGSVDTHWLAGFIARQENAHG